MIKILLLPLLLMQPYAPAKSAMVSKPPKNLTVKKATIKQFLKYCNRYTEHHDLPKSIYSTGYSTKMVRMKNCLNIKDMLIVIWIGDGRKINKIFSELVVLHYVAFVSRNKKTYAAARFIDMKSRNIKDKTEKVWFAFYSFKPPKN